MDLNTCNLLLVDDDIEFTNLVAEKLKRICGENLSVTVASSFDEASALLSVRSFNFAFVDCFLGEARTGLALIREFRNQGQDFPVAILSGATRGPLRRVALDLGAVAIIDKARCQAEQLAEIIDISTGAWCETGSYRAEALVA